MKSTEASILDIFATFLLLSYNKTQTVSFDLLFFTNPVNSTGHPMGSFLFYDPSYRYFGRSHLPYGIFGLVIFTCFNIVPFLLLIFYPMTLFQRCLNYFILNCITLHTFVDSFTGCYKDGTEPGTRDCRYFAALFLLLRIFAYICYQTTLNIYFFGLCGTITAVFTIALVTVQPYKQLMYAKYNTITPVMFMVITISLFSIININIALIKMNNMITFSVVIATIAILSPQLYILFLAFLWLYKLMKVDRVHHKQIAMFPQGNESSNRSQFQYQSIP